MRGVIPPTRDPFVAGRGQRGPASSRRPSDAAPEPQLGRTTLLSKNAAAYRTVLPDEKVLVAAVTETPRRLAGPRSAAVAP